MSNNDSKDLKDLVRDRYGKIAAADSMGCGCGCGCSDDSVPGFSVFKDEYDGIEGYVPDADLNLGCGIPTEFARIMPGDTVVDLGSGAGNDCFVARQLVGPEGEVIGVDMTPGMIQRAKSNAEELGFTNVKFRLGEIENLPLTAGKADVIISNCVINLVPDKQQAFHEMMRVLKPGGHICISDVVTEGTMPPALLEQAELYAGCVAGAIPMDNYLEIMAKSGLRNIRVEKRKQVEIPEVILQEFLSTSQVESFKDSRVGLYSITVTAEKPSCLCGCN